VHRRDAFRASKIMLDRARTNPKIKFLTNTAVEDVYDISQNLVTGVRLKNLLDGREWDQEVDGFFLAIGHIPNTKAFQRPDRSRLRRLHRQPRRRANQYHRRISRRRRADRTYRQAITSVGRRLHGSDGSGEVFRSRRALSCSEVLDVRVSSDPCLVLRSRERSRAGSCTSGESISSSPWSGAKSRTS